MFDFMEKWKTLLYNMTINSIVIGVEIHEWHTHAFIYTYL